MYKDDTYLTPNVNMTLSLISKKNKIVMRVEKANNKSFYISHWLYSGILVFNYKDFTKRKTYLEIEP